MELTVLMPCLNEAETVETCVRKAVRFIVDHGIDGEVVVADNGSTDGSQLLAVDAGARVVEVHEPGYGNALLGGIEGARGKYVIMGDADGSYDFTALMQFIDRLRDGADLVVGNRFQGGIEPGAMPALHRYLGNPLLSFVGRLFFRIKIGDFHCGLRGFRRESVLSLDLETPGMEFASEMVVRAALAGQRVEEVPTTLAPDGRSRPPHLRSWQDGWRHLRFLLLSSPRWLFLIPGSALLALGLVMAAVLTPVSHPLGSSALDANTLTAACVMIVIGFQSVIFALLARVHGSAAGSLPENERLNRLLAAWSLERGLRVSGLLAIAGAAGLAAELARWHGERIGYLGYDGSFRIAVLSVAVLLVSFQMIFGTFFLSILRTRRTRHPAPVDVGRRITVPSQIAYPDVRPAGLAEAQPQLAAAVQRIRVLRLKPCWHRLSSRRDPAPALPREATGHGRRMARNPALAAVTGMPNSPGRHRRGRPATPVAVHNLQIGTLRARLRADHMVRNSLYLILSSGLQAALGFVFWIVTARLFSTSEVGTASSLISATVLIAYLALLGLNSTFVRYLPTAPDRDALITAGILLVAVCGGGMGFLYLALTPFLAPRLTFVQHSPALAVGFLLLTAAGGVNLLTDSVFIAARKAGYNALVDGGVGGITKIAAAIVFAGTGSYGLFCASATGFVSAALASVLLITTVLDGRPSLRNPLRAVRPLLRFSGASYVGNILNLLPNLVVPLIVLDRLGASSAAYYFVAFQVATLLYSAAYAVEQTFLAEGSHTDAVWGDLLRRSRRVLVTLCLPACVVLILAAHWLLLAFGTKYSQHGTLSLILLAAAALPLAVNNWLQTLLRLLGQLRAIVISNTMYAAAICGLAWLLAGHGLTALAAAWPLGGLLSAGLTALPCVSALRAQRGGPSAPDRRDDTRARHRHSRPEHA